LAFDGLISVAPRSARTHVNPKPGELLFLLDDEMGPGTVLFAPKLLP